MARVHTYGKWKELKKSALFSEEDIVAIRLTHGVLADKVGSVLIYGIRT